MADILIQAEALSVRFLKQEALSAIDLSIYERGHLVLSGENGAGKSTLMQVLRGEQYPTAGSIRWRSPGGMDASPLSGRAMTALVSARQMEQYTCGTWEVSGTELLLTGLSDTRLVYKDATEAEQARVDEMARLFGVETLLSRELTTLSQGQLSLLLLARACIRRPKVLLLDEFTNALDTTARGRALDILDMLAEHCTLVMATHRRETLPQGILREVALEKGRVVYDGELRHAAKRAPAVSLSPAARAPEESAATPLIDIRDATVYVDRASVLRDITWAIRPGEHWAVLGENGAGKSTLLRLLAGEEYPALGGSVVRHAPDGQLVSDQETLRKGVRLLSDALQANYAYNLSGLDVVLSGFESSVGLYREYSPEELAEAKARIQLVGAGENLENRPIRTCSTGQLRRLLLARALVGAPYLLLLDEPFSGLDEGSRRHILHLLEQIAAAGTQLVVVSHHEADLPACVTRSVSVSAGRLTVSP